MNQLQTLQFLDKYSRWNYDENRRETWTESVERAVSFLREISKNKLTDDDYQSIHAAMLNMDAFCSMRLFAMAGDAARRCNSVLYNCSYRAIDSITAFAEVLYLSMSGVGAGYSVEHENISKLPRVKHQSESDIFKYTIQDSQVGWAQALQAGMSLWFNGGDIEFDYSEIRPAGAVLKTKGGRASGPLPLQRLLDFTRETILKAQGEKLTSIAVHDIVCMIGDCAVSGGARRSAMISLFDYDDHNMLYAKSGKWWKHRPQRANANNSVVIPRKLSYDEVKNIMSLLHENGSGEPGLFFRSNAATTSPRRVFSSPPGMNPCGEVNLHSQSFCNLSQAIIRPNDDIESLAKKVRIATIIGTIQSMADNFRFLGKKWKENSQKERLLGVDLTGQLDRPSLVSAENLDKLRQLVIDTNREYAERLGINQSVAVTCNKPSGNSSILFDCAPGIHTRWSDYYIRRMRISADSRISRMLRESGFMLYPENGQQEATATTFVVEFPVKAPAGAITNGDRSAIEQCEWWKLNKIHWTEHNPSTTILYEEHEINDLVKWIYNNQNIIGGMSFLPRDDHNYPLAPYEKISQDQYEEMVSEMPNIRFDLLQQYENEDFTNVAGEIACGGGACLI